MELYSLVMPFAEIGAIGDEAVTNLDLGRVWNRWAKRILLAFGLLFFLIGIVLLAREIAFQHDAVIGRGSVVELRVTESADGPNTSPVVEFMTLEGAPIRFEGVSTCPAATLGDAVPIIYRPADPQHARINTFVQRWLFPCIFILLGSLLILAGVYVARSTNVTR
jgi:hypothetical protein